SYKNKTEYAVVTAGLSNQVIAGDELLDWETRHALSLKRSEALYHPGTINVMAVFQEELDLPAKVNAVIAATEAKTAAMNILGYKETGTTSDAVAIVSPKGNSCFFAGTGSSHGIAAARAVRSGVCKALIKRDDFPVDMDDSTKANIRKEFGF
ncbi:MAG: adenosylcobinamide amidohydrolase, partial [Candidatus Methanomethylophilaceae archaeon]|nr:adenosylcobinamide amidohydrolase [Candidatus Methanomethylophilaceae archaeon]